MAGWEPRGFFWEKGSGVHRDTVVRTGLRGRWFLQSSSRLGSLPEPFGPYIASTHFLLVAPVAILRALALLTPSGFSRPPSGAVIRERCGALLMHMARSPQVVGGGAVPGERSPEMDPSREPNYAAQGGNVHFLVHVNGITPPATQ